MALAAVDRWEPALAGCHAFTRSEPTCCAVGVQSAIAGYDRSIGQAGNGAEVADLTRRGISWGRALPQPRTLTFARQ